MTLLLKRLVFYSIAASLVIHLKVAGADANSDLESVGEKSTRGQYGSDLRYLAKFYTPPQNSEESNHYIDMWAGRTTRDFAVASGLTNNHALIVNSHGKRVSRGARNYYGYYPHQELLEPNQEVPCFSASDLAAIVGPKNAEQIHNIMIAGCDADRAFSSTELRRYFVNATNITHTVPGKLGYQSMFLQVLVTDSANIEPLYESTRKNAQGKLEYHLEKLPVRKSVKLCPYVADLFKPGKTRPFRTQVAGRELLGPLPSFLTTSLFEQPSVPAM